MWKVAWVVLLAGIIVGVVLLSLCLTGHCPGSCATCPVAQALRLPVPLK